MKRKMMNWYHFRLGRHTHVRVFANGALCGHLCFGPDELENIQLAIEDRAADVIGFYSDREPEPREALAKQEPTPRDFTELQAKLIRAECDRDREARKVDQLELELMRLRSISNP